MICRKSFLAVVLAVATMGPAVVCGDVYYSLTGSFVDGSQLQSFFFSLQYDLGGSDPLTLRTWHYSGGTNAAGELIAGGGFDPWLRVYDSGGVELAYNDDIDTAADLWDSRIDRGMLPVPLPAGNYRLELGAVNGALGGRQPGWAVDLVASDNPGMYLTGASVVGGGTLSTLSLGSTGAGDPGLILESGQSMVFSSTLRLAHTGKGGLVLMPGASLQCQHIYLADAPGSFGSLGVVGPGTSLTLATGLTVGSQGTAMVSISDGGSVSQTALTISRLADAPGSQGFVMVSGKDKDGTRSRWDAVGPIWVGVGGLGSLFIAEGARVSSNGGCIACTSTAAGSVVSLSTSMGRTPAEWVLSGSLYVGGDEVAAGGTGTLAVQDGGLVTIPSDRTLKVWNTGTVQLVGGQISTGSFVVDSGGSFIHHNGILEVSSGIFSPGTPGHTIDGASAADLPTIKLLGGATATFSALLDAFIVGKANRGALEIRGGSDLTTGGWVCVGSESTSTGGSTLTVDGPGSTLTFTTPNYAPLWVGDHGKGSLVVSNGGQVIMPLGGAGTDGSWLGVAMSAGGDGEVIVDGAGSSIGHVLNLIVGGQGWGVLRIRNGGSVSCVSQGAWAMRVIGHWDATAVGLVDVTGVAADGTRSTLTIDAAAPTYPALVVGDKALGKLVISDGALVSTAEARIALTATAAGSWAAVGGWNVTRPPAEWSLSENLYVGGSDTAPGGSGLLLVYHGGLVTIAPGKTLKVWSTGQVELIDGQITTGSFVNSGGTFLHQNGILEVVGGTFDPGTSSHIIDGLFATDLPTVKLLDHARATLGSTGVVFVGKTNCGALEIRSGSHLTSGWGVIGEEATSTGGSTVTVDGPGSSWNLAGHVANVMVGASGKGSLLVSGGGQVTMLDPVGGKLIIGHATGGQGEVVVDGKDSSITNLQQAVVGDWGLGVLRVCNGGSVVGIVSTYEDHEIVGETAAGIVEVTGTAPDGTRSSWTTPRPIWVGIGASGTMTITNGALVTSAGADIARAPGSAGSSVTVGGWADQTPAEWGLSGALHVGGSNVGAGDTGSLTVFDGGLVSLSPGNTLRIWIPGTVQLFGGQITTGSFVNSGGTFLHHNGTLEVVGGVFDPGAFSHTIDGPTANERPTVNLRDGATANFAGTVIVGDANSGALGVRSGATLRSGVGMIGRQSTSTGSRAIVSGLSGSGTPAQWILGGGLYVGGSATAAGGQGTLSIGVGGVVNAVGPVKVWPRGTVFFQDGDLTAPFVELSGGRFSGYGILRSRVQSTNGIIDTPNPGDRLTLANRLEIMPGSTLQKTGAGNLILAHTQTWNSGAEFDVVAGSVDYLLSAPAAVALGATLVIQPGATVNAGGLFDPFTDAGDPGIHVDVLNEGAFNITAASKGIGQLTGAGTTTVSGSATLTADYVKQGSVLLAGTSGQPAKLVIRPSGGAMLRVGTVGNSPAPVPEPAVLWLLAAAGLCFYLFARRGRPVR